MARPHLLLYIVSGRSPRDTWPRNGYDNNNNNIHSCFQVTEEGQITKLPPCLVARRHAALVAWRHSLFLFGGGMITGTSEGLGNHVEQLDRRDGQNAKWMARSSLPFAAEVMVAVAVGNVIYVCGSTPLRWASFYFAIYYPEWDKWQVKEEKSTRCCLGEPNSLIYQGQKLFLIGNRRWWMFDLRKDKWVEIPATTEWAKSGSRAVASGKDRIWNVGGFHLEEECANPQDMQKIEQYTISTNTWLRWAQIKDYRLPLLPHERLETGVWWNPWTETLFVGGGAAHERISIKNNLGHEIATVEKQVVAGLLKLQTKKQPATLNWETVTDDFPPVQEFAFCSSLAFPCFLFEDLPTATRQAAEATIMPRTNKRVK